MFLAIVSQPALGDILPSSFVQFRQRKDIEIKY